MVYRWRRKEVGSLLKIDLHIHSKASDGKFSVAEIIKEAQTRNITFMAISDHDNISA
jgi:predicted metal-dependent phosphoesterase TrpH